MTPPRRRPLQRDNLGLEQLLTYAATVAPEWELGWSILRTKLREAGWPTRTPEDDRKPTLATGEGTVLDYADPTGSLALQLHRLTTDRTTLEEHWHLIQTSLHAIATITRKHLELPPPSIPACTITNCDAAVEHRIINGRTVYLNMDQIAGQWVTRPGTRPTCPRHRRNQTAA